jgi:hypothetical protein
VATYRKRTKKGGNNNKYSNLMTKERREEKEKKNPIWTRKAKDKYILVLAIKV